MVKKKSRRFFSAEEKVRILRRHLLEGELVSDLCEEYDLQPSQFYQWQKIFFENGAEAFKATGRQKKNPLEKKIRKLEEKLASKNEVLSELMEEHVKLKKNLGEI